MKFFGIICALALIQHGSGDPVETRADAMISSEVFNTLNSMTTSFKNWQTDIARINAHISAMPDLIVTANTQLAAAMAAFETIGATITTDLTASSCPPYNCPSQFQNDVSAFWNIFQNYINAVATACGNIDPTANVGGMLMNEMEPVVQAMNLMNAGVQAQMTTTQTLINAVDYATANNMVTFFQGCASAMTLAWMPFVTTASSYIH